MSRSPHPSRRQVAGQRSGECETFCRLAGEVGDEVEVLVQVEDGEVGEFCGGSDQEVGDRWCAVVAAFGWLDAGSSEPSPSVALKKTFPPTTVNSSGLLSP